MRCKREVRGWMISHPGGELPSGYGRTTATALESRSTALHVLRQQGRHIRVEPTRQDLLLIVHEFVFAFRLFDACRHPMIECTTIGATFALPYEISSLSDGLFAVLFRSRHLPLHGRWHRSAAVSARSCNGRFWKSKPYTMYCRKVIARNGRLLVAEPDPPAMYGARTAYPC